MNPNIRIARAWDACVITNYLAGKPEAVQHVKPLVAAAERGEIQIWASVFAQVEVAYLDVLDKAGGEATIAAFFEQDYMIPINLDVFVSRKARELVRDLGIKGKDAVHVASAIHWKVPLFETFDGELIRKFTAAAGNPVIGGIVVREPFYDGQPRFDL